MRGRRPRLGAALAAAALLLVAAGCVTAPPQTYYYTLALPAVERTEDSPSIEAGRFRATEPLQRHAILIRTAPTELEYYANHRWAARLDDLTQQELQRFFGLPDVREDTVALSGTILAFEQVEHAGEVEAHVRIEAEGRRKSASPEAPPLFREYFEARVQAASHTPQAVVRALCEALGRVAADMAEAVQRSL